MRKLLLFIAVFFAMISINANGQQQQDQLPLDPNVRKGVLPNGLTYYIQRNAQPKQQAEFFIAQKVGSMQEDETQLGLAHFLEHMAFNGTKNFPGNSLTKYLETIGVRFGENLNAYTSFDETVYNISNAPISRSNTIDSLLLILHDWSSFISLDGKEIDKERGVIREEWRSRNSGNRRVYEANFKTIFNGDLIGRRNPIGSMDIINSFPYDHIRNYYKKWYRPDLQGIVVVGDVDVDDIESRIRKIFSDIPKPINPAKRLYTSIKNNVEPIIAISTDAEVNRTSVSVFYKKDITTFTDRNTMAYYRKNMIINLIRSMINQRFAELTRMPNSPFQGIGAYYGSFLGSVDKDAWTINSGVKNGEALNALRLLLRENERMRRYGFTESELARAKLDEQTSYENAYNDREKQKHISFVQSYISNFLTNDPATGIEFDYKAIKELHSNLKLQEVNSLAQSLITDENLVITMSGPLKEGISTPSNSDVLLAVKEVKAEKVAPYEDKVITKPLLSEIPKSGKVVKEDSTLFGYVKWTLSNGAKVYFKKTDFKKDQIMMSGISEGGTSLLDIKDKPNYGILNELIPLGGFGDFDPNELDKVLAGKFVGVRCGLSMNNEQINGYSSPKDFETLMQLTYLKLTQPRKDTIAFKNFISKKKNQIENANLQPEVVYSDLISKTLYSNHPFVERYNLDMLGKVDYDRVLAIYRDRFSNAGDFSFIFTGNIDPNAVRSSIETYIGGLPSTSKAEKWKDIGLRYVSGVKKAQMERGAETPKSTIFVNLSGKAKYSLENIVLMNFVSSVLDLRYIEEIREKEGGAYGVSVSGNVGNIPIEQFELQIYFTTDPKLKDKLLAIVNREIQNLIQNGPSQSDLTKVKEFLVKKYGEQQIENRFWQTNLTDYLFGNIDNTNYLKVVQNVTPEMVKNAAKEWLTQGNVVEVTMSPKEK